MFVSDERRETIMEKEAMLIELQKKVIALEVRIAELEAQPKVVNNYYHTHFPVQVPNPPTYPITNPPYTTC